MMKLKLRTPWPESSSREDQEHRVGAWGGEGGKGSLAQSLVCCVWDVSKHLGSLAASAGTCTEKDRSFPTGCLPLEVDKCVRVGTRFVHSLCSRPSDGLREVQECFSSSASGVSWGLLP